MRAIRLVDASAGRGPAAARNIGAGLGTRRPARVLRRRRRGPAGMAPGHVVALSRCGRGGGRVRARLAERRASADPEPRRDAPARAPACRTGREPRVSRDQAFEAVGGFDENLRVGEDIDLCWRLQFAGFTVRHRARAVVSKRERADGRRASSAKGITHGRSGPRLYRKHRDAGIRRDLTGALKSWGWLVIQVPRLFDREDRTAMAASGGRPDREDHRVGREPGVLP